MTLTTALVGTGFWAESVHAPSLAASRDVRFVGVWGRNREASESIARKYGVTAFDSFERLLDAVDIVDFAVPPVVQKPLALAAASVGRHLLLEKPIGLDLADAKELGAGMEAAGVASVVFVTRMFDPMRVAWAATLSGGNWSSAHAELWSGALVPGGPYDNSIWRRQAGALWDLGPHVISQVVPILGKVTGVAVSSHDPGGFTEIALWHAGGGSTTARLTLHALPADKRDSIEFTGIGGTTRSPSTPIDPVASHSRAIAVLANEVEALPLLSGDSGKSYSVPAGVDSIAVLGTLQRLVDRGQFASEPTPVGGAK